MNLEINLSQLNLNAAQSLVALWALYRLLNFPELTVEELQAAYAVKNSHNYNSSYYFQSFEGCVITSRDDSMKSWKDYGFEPEVRGKRILESLKILGGRADHMESGETMCGVGQGVRRRPHTHLRNFGYADRDETVPCPDSVGGAQLHGVAALPCQGSVRRVPC